MHRLHRRRHVNKRAALARVFEATGISGLALAVQRCVGSPWLPILTFHRARDIDDAFELDEGVVDTTPDELARHVATVRRFFTPIGTAELIAHVEGAPLPTNPILISFDDGYRDNFEIALPILRRHDVKAMFFIATTYVTERRVFWWDHISYLVKRARRATLALSYPRDVEFDLSTTAARRAAQVALFRMVKSSFRIDLARLLEDLSRATAVAWTDAIERRLADEHVMTWNHVRALRAAGMDVESHSRSHRVLQTLDAAQLADELRGSRDDLERELGVPVRAISYPVGNRITDRRDIRDALASAGYQVGLTNATGINPAWRRSDRFDVGRIGMDSRTPEATFRALLAAPSLFS